MMSTALPLHTHGEGATQQFDDWFKLLFTLGTETFIVLLGGSNIPWYNCVVFVEFVVFVVFVRFNLGVSVTLCSNVLFVNVL